MNDGLALSALDWWAEAGVDIIVDDLPHDWLGAAALAMPEIDRTIPPDRAQPDLGNAQDDRQGRIGADRAGADGDSADRSPPARRIGAASAATPVAFPATLADFRAWLLADQAVPGPAAARLDAGGDPASGAMVVLDMPEAGDRAAGRLLSGEAGALFDRMLTAMKLDRDAIYLAPFSPARPASGRLNPSDAAALGHLMRHHITLVAPKRVLLMGDTASRLLLGQPLPQARGDRRMLDISGMSFPAIASFTPRFVLERPDYRKAAWADLQMFMAL